MVIRWGFGALTVRDTFGSDALGENKWKGAVVTVTFVAGGAVKARPTSAARGLLCSSSSAAVYSPDRIVRSGQGHFGADIRVRIPQATRLGNPPGASARKARAPPAWQRPPLPPEASDTTAAGFCRFTPGPGLSPSLSVTSRSLSLSDFPSSPRSLPLPVALSLQVSAGGDALPSRQRPSRTRVLKHIPMLSRSSPASPWAAQDRLLSTSQPEDLRPGLHPQGGPQAAHAPRAVQGADARPPGRRRRGPRRAVRGDRQLRLRARRGRAVGAASGGAPPPPRSGGRGAEEGAQVRAGAGGGRAAPQAGQPEGPPPAVDVGAAGPGAGNGTVRKGPAAAREPSSRRGREWLAGVCGRRGCLGATGRQPALEDQLVGLLADEGGKGLGALDAARDAGGLHPRREADGVAHQRVLEALRADHGADDGAAVDADADLHAAGRAAVLAAGLVDAGVRGRLHGGDSEAREAGRVVVALVLGEVCGRDVCVADDVDLLNPVQVGQAIKFSEEPVQKIRDLPSTHSAAYRGETHDVREKDRRRLLGHGFNPRALQLRHYDLPWKRLHQCKVSMLSAAYFGFPFGSRI